MSTKIVLDCTLDEVKVSNFTTGETTQRDKDLAEYTAAQTAEAIKAKAVSDTRTSDIAKAVSLGFSQAQAERMFV